MGYVPYRWCQYIISLEDKDSTEQTKSDDLRYTRLHLMEVWRIPETEEPSGLASMRSQRVGHDSVAKHTSTGILGALETHVSGGKPTSSHFVKHTEMSRNTFYETIC